MLRLIAGSSSASCQGPLSIQGRWRPARPTTGGSTPRTTPVLRPGMSGSSQRPQVRRRRSQNRPTSYRRMMPAASPSIRTSNGLWQPERPATSCIFGTDPTPDSNEWKVDQAETTFDPEMLEYNTIYYWQVDSKNDVGTITGDVWRFRTEAEPRPKPAQATSPQPAHSETGVSRSTNLVWSAAVGATSYVVYFGTATLPGSDELQGEQSVTSFAANRLRFIRYLHLQCGPPQ